MFASRSIDLVMELQFNCGDKKTDFFFSFSLTAIKWCGLQRINFGHEITWPCWWFLLLLRQPTCLSSVLQVHTSAPLDSFQKEGPRFLFREEELPSLTSGKLLVPREHQSPCVWHYSRLHAGPPAPIRSQEGLALILSFALFSRLQLDPQLTFLISLFLCHLKQKWGTQWFYGSLSV